MVEKRKAPSGFYRQHWDQKKQYHETLRNRGRVVLKPVAGRIQVIAPFNEEFRISAMGIGGRWRPRSRVWTFPGVTREQRMKLADILVTAYGIEAIPEWLTAKPCLQCQRPVTIQGHDLCVECEREQVSLQRLTAR